MKLDAEAAAIKAQQEAHEKADPRVSYKKPTDFPIDCVETEAARLVEKFPDWKPAFEMATRCEGYVIHGID